ncbi:hypothetical protein Tco_0801258 [Tanacetum coccineum]|uniref:Uncharacterized protein n=1 Tax=Tanacetum coccineum TaxID=301880 RepID=A0ABQ4ZVG5_9ASTR
MDRERGEETYRSDMMAGGFIGSCVDVEMSVVEGSIGGEECGVGGGLSGGSRYLYIVSGLESSGELGDRLVGGNVDDLRYEVWGRVLLSVCGMCSDVRDIKRGCVQAYGRMGGEGGVYWEEEWGSILGGVRLLVSDSGGIFEERWIVWGFGRVGCICEVKLVFYTTGVEDSDDVVLRGTIITTVMDTSDGVSEQVTVRSTLMMLGWDTHILSRKGWCLDIRDGREIQTVLLASVHMDITNVGGTLSLLVVLWFGDGALRGVALWWGRWTRSSGLEGVEGQVRVSGERWELGGCDMGA